MRFILIDEILGGIEQGTVAFAADFSLSMGVQFLLGEFLPTSTNQPAAEFYERIGFEKRAETLFRVDLRLRESLYPAT